MKKIMMDYPMPNGMNTLFDGTSHVIVPSRLSSVIIGGTRFYLLEYYDESMGAECETLLTVINGQFAKVPLDNYDLLDELLADLSVRAENLDTLPRRIALCETLPVYPLIKGKFQQELILEFNRYMAYDAESITDSRGRKYASACVKTEISQEETQEYIFWKTPDYALLDNRLQRELSSHLFELRGQLSVEISFLIDVAPGTTAVLPEIVGNRLVEKSLLLIPGKHQYNFFLTPCTDKERDKSSTRCRTCSVYAPLEGYRDLHDTKKAFKNGFNGILDMSFDSTLSNTMQNRMR